MAVDIKDGDQSEKPDLGPNTEGISTSSQDGNGTSSPGTLEETGQNTLLAKAIKAWNWIPQRCRYDPENPPNFTLALNILFAFVCYNLLHTANQQTSPDLTSPRAEHSPLRTSTTRNQS